LLDGCGSSPSHLSGLAFSWARKLQAIHKQILIGFVLQKQHYHTTWVLPLSVQRSTLLLPSTFANRLRKSGEFPDMISTRRDSQNYPQSNYSRSLHRAKRKVDHLWPVVTVVYRDYIKQKFHWQISTARESNAVSNR